MRPPQSGTLSGAAAASAAASTGPAASSTRFRQRKLNTKHALKVVRETHLAEHFGDDVAALSAVQSAGSGDIDPATGLSTASLPKVESGVEHKEEKEHHLQVALNASHAAVAGGGQASAISIPTPETKLAQDIDYAELYECSAFQQPATYIRFSATVEDTTGPNYCMTEGDEAFLGKLNKGRASKHQCTEDHFEQVMSSFENTSSERQPYAAVDGADVLSFEELLEAFDDEMVSQPARMFAKEIYGYWREMKTENASKPLMPTLKTLRMETGQETDDSDPYVCFRRREVRQARKTRGRDAQVMEKVRKLRRELEDARSLMTFLKEREILRKEDLRISKRMFEQRLQLRGVKRTMPASNQDADEELLVNQKPAKRTKTEMPQQQQTTQQQNSKQVNAGLARPGATVRTDVPAPEDQVFELRFEMAKRERNILSQIENLSQRHERWNKDYVDDTENALFEMVSLGQALLPVAERQKEKRTQDSFVSMKVETRPVLQEPTPPASESSDVEMDDEESADVAHAKQRTKSNSWRWADPEEYETFNNQPRLRRRMGRGGRMMLDRHNFQRNRQLKVNVNGRSGVHLNDRYRYDEDDGDRDRMSSPDLDSAEGFRYRTIWASREATLAAQQRRQSLSNSERISASSRG